MTVLSNSSNPRQEMDFSHAAATRIEMDDLQPTHLEHYGPLAHVNTVESRLPAFAGELQPGLYRTPKLRKYANPAPLGLSGFALTTFVLGCINMGTRNITEPNMVVGVAYSYGGLVQLLAGMWEMAAGNTFGATALSSYGGFWIALGITFTPGFQIMSELQKADNGSTDMFYDSYGLFLMGWFAFTFLLLTCTVKSTAVFFSLFLSVDVAFLLLGLGHLHRDSHGMPNPQILKAGGLFALIAAFLAWYSALAGIADDSNSFFIIPVFHFPWSEKGRASRREAAAAV
ncbi:GPR1/FUN34/yaaH protein [Penicillium griseofulvum]|uniref:GPR1/FUN34/yaaH protein n=1 Tax=Penicillium patulum TaxID=5078 RepID=A0A135LJJ7_PENPA|nr:GPR1/FUN34/yaaH protein [Penicillium griseofulvum]KXG49145.1 GPR1/FUN34/yaaH protein [Penicillium griseofulvum]